MNAVLALRIKDESDQQARLRAEAANLQAEVDALRRAPSVGGGSVLERIAAAAAEIRQLRFKNSVDAEVLTDEQLKVRVETQFKKDNPRAEVEANDKVLTALGLLKPNDDLYDILLGLHTEQVAGFYDTDAKKLVVGGDAKNPTPLDRVLLAHEYVHALTDQLYNLSRIDKLYDQDKDDEAFAYVSLIEGDATVSMGTYAEKYLTPSEQREYIAESSRAPLDKYNAAPKVLRRALLFPYDEGVRFVRDLMTSGGLAAVNRAYQEPPTSTEQILHSTKFTGRRDEPTAVTTPDLARAMGSGWRALDQGGVGEFDVQVIVNEYLPRADADSAASGWDGGRYAAAESSSGVVVAALTVWDSETEARQATDALGRWLPKRFGNQGQDVRFAGATGRGWESPNGAGGVFRSGSKVLLIVGPDRVAVQKARAAFAGF
jgi:hypothetical protein